MRQPPGPPGSAERRLHLGTAEVAYLVRPSPRSKGIRATIDHRHGLVVTVPRVRRSGPHVSDAAVEAFLLERGGWILRNLARHELERAEARERARLGVIPYRGEPHRVRVIAQAGRSSVERVGGDEGDALVIRTALGERRSSAELLRDWLRDRAAEAIRDAVASHAPALGVRPGRIDLRDPRSRWGSASRRGRLMFSWRLVLAPPASLETVVVHELAHLRVFGHGPPFWALVAARRPEHLADRAWLRRHSHALHTALDPGVD